jgi:lysophospholipase L1-like esterase
MRRSHCIANLLCLLFLASAYQAAAQTPPTLLHRWSLDAAPYTNNASSPIELTSGNNHTPSPRFGVNNGALQFAGGFLQSTQDPLALAMLTSTDAFSVSGWFSLENTESYLGASQQSNDDIPRELNRLGASSQILACQWHPYSSAGRRWALLFETERGTDFPCEGTIDANRPSNAVSGRICFKIASANGSSIVSVSSPFQVYTDGPFFVAASYDPPIGNIYLFAGNELKIYDTFKSLGGVTINPASAPLKIGATGAGATAQDVAESKMEKFLLASTRTTTPPLNQGLPYIDSLQVSSLRGSADEFSIWRGAFSKSDAEREAKTSYPGCGLKKRIAFLGNSITWGYSKPESPNARNKQRYEELPTGTTGSYPALVGYILRENGYSVANYACPGTVTGYGIQKFDFGNLPITPITSPPGYMTAGAKEMNYDWVVVSYGINDLRNLIPTNPTAPILQADLESIKDQLRTLYRSILESNSGKTKLLKLTITPFKNDVGLQPDRYTQAVTNALNDINNFIKDYNLPGYEQDIVLLDNFELMKDTRGGVHEYAMRADFEDDGIHPSKKGLQVIAKAVANAIYTHDQNHFRLTPVATPVPAPVPSTGAVTRGRGVSVTTAPVSTPYRAPGITPIATTDITTNAVTTIKKIALTGWNNAGGFTGTPVPVGGYVTYTVSPAPNLNPPPPTPPTAATGTSIMVGLSTIYSGGNYVNVDNAIYTRFDNRVYIHKKGDVQIRDMINTGIDYTESTTFTIKRETSTEIGFYIDGTKRGALTLPSTPNPPKDLFLDFAIYNETGTIKNLRVFTPNNCGSPPTALSRPLVAAPLDLPNKVEAQQTGTQLEMYPNPAHQTVVLEGTAGGTAQLLDGLGRVLRTVSLPDGHATINLTGVTPGLYLVRVGATTKRLMVE